MSRDMQIGLLLAVGFLALVGGVLFYRIEHPDELEQFLNGNETHAAATTTPGAPDTSKPDVSPTADKPANSGTGAGTGAVALNTNKPPAPVNNPPALDGSSPFNLPPPTSNPSPVVQTDAPASTATVTTAPTSTTIPTTASSGDKKSGVAPAAAAGTAGALTLGALASDKKDDKRSVPTAPAATPTKPDAGSTARTSMPVDPPVLTTPPAPPAATAPTIALDLTPKTTTTPPVPPADTKKATEMVIKPDAATASLPPPGMSPPAMSPPSVTGTTPPTAPAASGGIVMSDPSKSQLTPEKKSNEMPQPPVVTPPANGGIAFDTTKPAPPTGGTPLLNNPATNVPPPATTTPSLAGTPPMNSPLNTTITPSHPPVTATPTNTNPLPVTEGDGFRTSAPKAGLGKPLPESEVALREKRWGESAGNPAPIIPSSVDNRTSPNNVVPAVTTGRRGGVVQDTYMPTERAMPGETFSSLSQRLYGDTNYAVALAAFNKEEGFVKLDQPTPGELVAKPNREILDQKYPQYVRRLTPTNLNQTSATMMANNANAPVKNGAAPPAATGPLPTYRVGKGEQLFEVAKKTLGDGYRWSEIYALNKDMLRDSTELRPDMVLKLPAEAKK